MKMKKFVAELARNGRHFNRNIKAETEYEARLIIGEYLAKHPGTEFWNFREG